MLKNFQVFRETKSWKKPIHITKAVLAKNYLKLLPGTDVIAVTGSVGKTLTQNALFSTLSQKFSTVAGEENLDPTFRIPQTILKTKIWNQKMILEFGVEHPHDMDYYLSIVIPKIAVVTKISPTHTRYLKNVEGVFHEKAKFVEAMPKNSAVFLNADDPYCHKMAKLTKARVIWYGRTAKKGVKISHFEQGLNGSKFRMHANGQKASVKWKIIGYHQLTTAYAAAQLGIFSGLTLKQIAKGLSTTKVPSHRLSVARHKTLKIIDDTYNSSPEAVKESIKTLVAIGKSKQKIAILGEMRDLGSQSEEMHDELGRIIAKTGIKYLITVGNTAQIIAKSAKKSKFRGQVLTAKNIKEAIEKTKKIIKNSSVILVKGSRHEHLERIVYSLLGKTTRISCYHCGNLN